MLCRHIFLRLFCPCIMFVRVSAPLENKTYILVYREIQEIGISLYPYYAPAYIKSRNEVTTIFTTEEGGLYLHT